MLRRVEPVAAGDREPVRVGDGTSLAATRSAPCAIILRAAADVVGNLKVVADVVELTNGKIRREVVVATAVPGNRDAAIVADDEVIRVVGIDPHRVMVDVNADRRVADRLAAVIGKVERRRRPVDAIRVLGVDAHL